MDVKESHKQWKKINSGKFIERLVFIAFCFVICALIIAFKYYILIPFRSNHNNSSTKIPKVKTGKHINKNFIKQEN